MQLSAQHPWVHLKDLVPHQPVELLAQAHLFRLVGGVAWIGVMLGVVVFIGLGIRRWRNPSATSRGLPPSRTPMRLGVALTLFAVLVGSGCDGWAWRLQGPLRIASNVYSDQDLQAVEAASPNTMAEPYVSPIPSDAVLPVQSSEREPQPSGGHP